MNDICACGCRRPVTAASPSPWWAGVDCYQTWAAQQAGLAAEAIAELVKDGDPWADVFTGRPTREPVVR